MANVQLTDEEAAEIYKKLYELANQYTNDGKYDEAKALKELANKVWENI